VPGRRSGPRPRRSGRNEADNVVARLQVSFDKWATRCGVTHVYDGETTATPGAQVVDVRSVADYAAGHLSGAVSIQLRGALSKVSLQEIEWAQGEVNRVLESLKRLSTELSHLAALKSALEHGH